MSNSSIVQLTARGRQDHIGGLRGGGDGSNYLKTKDVKSINCCVIPLARFSI